MPTLLAFVIYFIGSMELILATNWTTDSMQKADNAMVGGAYNGEIYIIGGNQYGFQFTIYDIATGGYTFKGASYFTMDIAVTGQAYTQQGAILYIIEPDTSRLSIYNFSKTPIRQESSWNDVALVNIDDQACLASTENFLFFTGTAQDKTEFKALDLSTLQWLTLPLRQEGRLGHGCVIAKDVLYLAGGWRHKSSGLIMWIKSTEYFDVSDIYNTQQQWQYGPDLFFESTGGRCVTNKDYVFIVGGDVMSSSPLNMVQIWDTFTNTMDYLPDWMPIGHAYSLSLIVDGTLHTFGGLCCSAGGQYSNHHLMYPIGTAKPTMAPTGDSVSPSSAPTEAPTIPTVAPSSDPTSGPTSDPTADPTVDPTQFPTVDPTNDPTNDPTFKPTDNPTNVPTYVPTFGPTFDPTLTPTFVPTYDPTYDPTKTETTEMDLEEDGATTGEDTPQTLSVFGLALIIVSAVSFLVIVFLCADAKKETIKRIIGKCCGKKTTDTGVLADVVNETVEEKVDEKDDGIVPGVKEEGDGDTEEEEEEDLTLEEVEGGGKAEGEGRVVDTDAGPLHADMVTATGGATIGDDAHAAYALADV